MTNAVYMALLFGKLGLTVFLPVSLHHSLTDILRPVWGLRAKFLSVYPYICPSFRPPRMVSEWWLGGSRSQLGGLWSQLGGSLIQLGDLGASWEDLDTYL